MLTLSVKETDIQLFREIVTGIPWETALWDKGVEQRWQIFKEVGVGYQYLYRSRLGQEQMWGC